jgi:phosphoribosylanthranilate isomerase
MNGITVKICGLQRPADVRLCQQLGVDILGFVTEYPLPVPWNLSRQEALPLLQLVRPPCRSCLVTGGPPEKVIELATSLRPSMVQLHYKETLDETIRISDALQKLNIQVIKLVPTQAEDRMAQFGTADIAAIGARLCTTSLYGLLADSRSPANASQVGVPLDQRFCTEIIKVSSKPVFIAGGINPENVRSLLEQTGAEYIDVLTGVESSPGVKDAETLSRLVSSLGH